MKKSTIWIIAIIMGFSFLALLYLQLSYIEEMAKMKKEQFDESVNRSLYQASRNLEVNETLRYLEKDVNETERRAFRQDSVSFHGDLNNGTVTFPPVCRGRQGRHDIFLIPIEDYHHQALYHPQGNDTEVGQELNQRGFEVAAGDSEKQIRLSEGVA